MNRLIISIAVLITTLNVYGQNEVKKYDSIISAKDLKNDLNDWYDWIHKTHPDLSHRIKDIDAFYKTFDSIKENINEPMTKLEFWRKISILNNTLSDCHMGVGRGSSIVKLSEFLANDGLLFPFEVVFNENNLLIRSDLGTYSHNTYTSYRITKINKVPIEIILRDLLLRVNGDSETIRKEILARSFSRSFLLLYGEKKEFDIEYEYNGNKFTIHANGSNEMPKYVKIDEFFNDNYKFEVIDKKNALLTVGSFYWKNREQYLDFMDTAFKTLKEKNIKHLIIDVRENGGGNDENWMEGILKYIADKPYRWGSNFKVKILAHSRDKGEVVGSVETGDLDKFIPVNETTPYKYNGQVSVIIGPYTYSSAILFANTVQDYNFATLVGEPTGGRSTQTGGVENMIFKNSKLKTRTPRFILERPNGGLPLESVVPDKIINYSKINPESLISKVLIE